MEAITLEPLDSLTVTTLVDNVIDKLLVDEGTPDGMVENMARLDISAGDIDVIVLSHGIGTTRGWTDWSISWGAATYPC